MRFEVELRPSLSSPFGHRISRRSITADYVEPEMHPQIVLRIVAAAAADFLQLHSAGPNSRDARSMALRFERVHDQLQT